MANPVMDNNTLLEKLGRRSPGQTIDQPSELGYRCPMGHYGDILHWSEFNQHLWCNACGIDWPAERCPIARPCWMNDEQWTRFIGSLPFTPIILPITDMTMAWEPWLLEWYATGTFA